MQIDALPTMAPDALTRFLKSTTRFWAWVYRRRRSLRTSSLCRGEELRVLQASFKKERKMADRKPDMRKASCVLAENFQSGTYSPWIPDREPNTLGPEPIRWAKKAYPCHNLESPFLAGGIDKLQTAYPADARPI